nr:acanthoscurrin-1-like [Salvelinus alpinus]
MQVEPQLGGPMQCLQAMAMATVLVLEAMVMEPGLGTQQCSGCAAGLGGKAGKGAGGLGAGGYPQGQEKYGGGVSQLPYNGAPVNTAGLDGDGSFPYGAQQLGLGGGDGGKSAGKYGNGGLPQVHHGCTALWTCDWWKRRGYGAQQQVIKLTLKTTTLLLASGNYVYGNCLRITMLVPISGGW